MADGGGASGGGEGLTLVARKGGFGLPTACPACLPAYLYLRLAQAPFALEFDTKFPDADHIPYVEYGDCVAFNNEKGGVIEYLKRDNIVDLNANHPGIADAELVATKAMITSWLADAVLYELWIAIDSGLAHSIYFSDLPWPIGKLLYWKQSTATRQVLGITKLNASEREEEIYRKANISYDALSLKLGDQVYFFDNRPTDVDALFLGHALFVLLVLPETSALRSNFAKHENLVKYAEHLRAELLEIPSLSSLPRQSNFDATRSKSSFKWRSKQKPKENKVPTEEEKTFRRRAKYFLVTQLVAVLAFLTLMSGVDTDQLDEDDDGIEYEE